MAIPRPNPTMLSNIRQAGQGTLGGVDACPLLPFQILGRRVVPQAWMVQDQKIRDCQPDSVFWILGLSRPKVPFFFFRRRSSRCCFISLPVPVIESSFPHVSIGLRRYERYNN